MLASKTYRVENLQGRRHTPNSDQEQTEGNFCGASEALLIERNLFAVMIRISKETANDTYHRFGAWPLPPPPPPPSTITTTTTPPTIPSSLCNWFVLPWHASKIASYIDIVKLMRLLPHLARFPHSIFHWLLFYLTIIKKWFCLEPQHRIHSIHYR